MNAVVGRTGSVGYLPDKPSEASAENLTGGWGSLLGRIVEAMIEADSLGPGPKPLCQDRLAWAALMNSWKNWSQRRLS